ncbi:MAG: hypothetical protein ACREM6_09170 [Vulcanimicrobiaceae bacterium]
MRGPARMRAPLAVLTLFAFTATAAAPRPAAAATPLRSGTQAQAESLLHTSCAAEVAQTTATPEPSIAPTASPTPIPTPTATPAAPTPNPPAAPAGPVQLIPPTTATSPPPPLPTPTPTPSAASGPVYIAPPAGSPPPIVPKGATPTPSPAGGVPSAAPSPAASPSAFPTLGPDEIAIRADRGDRLPNPGHPADLDGHVAIYYQEGVIAGEHAHFDGDHTWTLTGHPYLVNKEQTGVLYADRILFDTNTRKATLEDGRGETTQGVERGEIYYTAQTLTSTQATTHGVNATFSTCEHPRGGYHIQSKTLDITPGDKLVARHNLLFLGAAAIFYIPLIVIPLKNRNLGLRRRPAFIPELGYDKAEGFFIKARVGFGTSDHYYGYYRIDFYSKRGLGLGYNGTFTQRNNKRAATLDFYTIDDHIINQRQTNFNLQDTENFSQRLRGQFGINYTGDYGAGITIPPAYNITGSLSHIGVHSSEGLTFARFIQGSQSNDTNLGFIDQLQLSPTLQQGINLSYTDFSSAFSTSSTFHLNTLTHLFTRRADYNLTIDKTDSSSPSGYDKVPELQILPHFLFPGIFRTLQTQVTLGNYTEPVNHFSTSRADFNFIYPLLFHVLGDSALSTNLTLRQDLYGTGDEKAQVTQQATLTTPVGNHIVNAITYNEQNPIGPSIVPFQLLDHLPNGYKQAAEVFRLFNGNVYALTLSTATQFNRQAQPVEYQISSHPSPRSTVNLGGAFVPGPGNGFFATNVQVISPFGFATDIAFTTNIDWKNKGRLENKTLYYHKIIGGCYEFRIGYNQDLKQVNVTVDLLAFPSYGANFGIGNAGPILPGSLAY